MVDTLKSEAIKAGIQRRREAHLPLGNPSFQRQGMVSKILCTSYYEKYIEPLAILGHTQSEIALILNRHGILSPRGKHWTQSAISKIKRKVKGLLF